MGKLISIVTGKGGMGKSTLTELVATFLNAYTDLKITVIDADVDQNTLVETRATDILNLQTNIYLQNLYKKRYIDKGKKLYEVIGLLPTNKLITYEIKEGKIFYKKQDIDYLETLAKIVKQNDLTFIDFPGSKAVPGVKETMFYLDYAITPIYFSKKIFLESIRTLSYLKKLKESDKSRLKDFAGFINRYEDRKHKKFNEKVKNLLEEKGIKMLSPVYYNKDYELDRYNTLKPIENSPYRKNISYFINDVLKLIKLEKEIKI